MELKCERTRGSMRPYDRDDGVCGDVSLQSRFGDQVLAILDDLDFGFHLLSETTVRGLPVVFPF